MRILLAISACWQYNYPKWVGHPLHRRTDHRMSALLSTWWQEIGRVEGADGRLFFGRKPASAPSPDMLPQAVELDAPDEYDGLKHKLRAMCTWSNERDYDWTVKLDDDTAVDLPALVRLIERCQELPDHDYVGQVFDGYCYGGAGFLLSRRAAREIALREIPSDVDAGRPQPTPDDHWAGIALRSAGIHPRPLDCFNSETGVTFHCRKVGDMERWWKNRQAKICS